MIPGIIIVCQPDLATAFSSGWTSRKTGKYPLSQYQRYSAQPGKPVAKAAYFSENMPPNIEKSTPGFPGDAGRIRQLVKGYVDYQFINPDEEEAANPQAAYSQ